jgi:hypothetical protein
MVGPINWNARPIWKHSQAARRVEYNKMANSAVVSHIVLLWVWICLATGSTGAAFSLEEEFLHLKENYVRSTEFRFHTSVFC